MTPCVPHQYRYEPNGFVCKICGFRPADDHNGPQSLVSEEDGKYRYFPEQGIYNLACIEKGYFWFEHRNQLIVDIIQTYFKNAECFCEFGCGTGYTLSYIQKKLPHLTLFGSDVYMESLAVSRRKTNHVCLFQSDILKTLIDQAFDVVGAFDVIEHVRDDQLALSNLYHALRPGGGIILTVPQHRWMWSCQDEKALHKRRYDRKELLIKAEAVGFKTTKIISFMSLLFPLQMVSRFMINQQHHSDQMDFTLKEFQISTAMNQIFRRVCSVERRLINKGYRFPFGGSLLYCGVK